MSEPSQSPSLKSKDDAKPVVPADSQLPELTVKALLVGLILAVILGAANVYLALKAGQTVSGMFPAAVIAMAVFRSRFLPGNLLEQNIARTTASVGEALAAGAIFTIPAFLLAQVGGQHLWESFRYWETTLILMLGGVLGVLFITLLRRTLTVDADLPWPESRACTEIVKAGEKGDSGARYVFGALGLGALLQFLKDSRGIQLFQESLSFAKDLPSSVIHHFDTKRQALGDVTHKGLFRCPHRRFPRPDRRGLHHRLRALGDQFRGRRARLAGSDPLRRVPEP